MSSTIVDTILDYTGSSLVLAGPGTGKTTLLIKKLSKVTTSNSISDGRKVLVLTFNKKAAVELKTRLHLAGVQQLDSIEVYTYHGFGHRLLRAYGSCIGIVHPLQLFPASDRKAYISKLEQHFGAASFDLFYQRYQSKYGDEQRDAFVKMHAQEYKTALMEYEKFKTESGYLDFSELVSRSVELLSSRPWIRNIIGDCYPIILIDEFQDTDQVQFELLALLGDNSHITAVADEDQIIYSFRGVENKNIRRFIDHFSAQQFSLVQNHRSTDTIVQVANHVIANNPSRISLTPMTTNNAQGEKIIIFLGGTLDAEVEQVCSIVRRWSSTGTGNIAILCREKAQIGKHLISKIVQQLSVDGISVYQLKSGVLTRDPVIQWLLAALHLLHEQTSESLANFSLLFPGIGKGAASKLLAVPCDGKSQSIFEVNLEDYITKKQSETLSKALHRLEQMTSVLDVFDLACSIVYNGRENEYDKKRTWYLDIRRLLAAEKRQSWEHFIRNYEYILDVGNLLKLSHNEVFIGTIHQVKGLEFSNVIICGVSGNYFPADSSVRDNLLDEERRLFYVAITRAKERLAITGCRQWYNPMEKSLENLPISTFLRELPSGYCEVIK